MRAPMDNGSDALAGELQQKMQRLSYRNLQLWLIALFVLMVVVSGVVAPALLSLFWRGTNLRVETHSLPQVLFGLIGIVILFDLYVLQQRRELDQAREHLALQLMERQRSDSATMVDPPTQLLNQRYLDYILPKEVHRAKREGSSLSLLMVSVEDTRDITQRLGNGLGNHWLLEIAHAMETTFRLSDTVLRDSSDRFLVLMPNTLGEQADIAARRLLAMIAALGSKSEGPCPMVLSYGISTYQEGADISDVLRMAEQNLHEQKRRQRKEPVLRTEARPQALLACNDSAVLGMLHPILDSLEIAVDLCTTMDKVMGALDGRKLDALLLDCGEQDQHLNLLPRIRSTSRGRRLLVVAIVNQGTVETAYRLGANIVLTKPLSVELTTSSLRVVRGMMVGEEQRFFRHAVETTAHLNFGQALVQVAVSHLSEGGMVVRTTVPLEPNHTATLRFTLPGLAQPLEAQGEVAWVSPEGRAGIRFVHVPLSSRRLLQRWLADTPQTGKATVPVLPASAQGSSLGEQTVAETVQARRSPEEVARHALLVPTSSWGNS